MIQPIRQSLAFKGNEIPTIYQNITKTQQQTTTQPQPRLQNEPPKEGIIKKSKKGFMGFLKGFNNVKNMGSGILRGAVEGVIAGSLVGVFGYNYKKNNGEFFKTVGGSIKNIAGEAWKFIRNIPSIITKRSPLNTVTTIVKEPFKQMKKLKGNIPTIVAAVAVGTAIMVFRTIQGKINANRANADIDHSLNEGHIPTK